MKTATVLAKAALTSVTGLMIVGMMIGRGWQSASADEPAPPSTGNEQSPGAAEPVYVAPSGRAYVGGLPGDAPLPEPGMVPAGDMPQPTYAPPPLPVNEDQSYTYFYEPLQPHGEWIYMTAYGLCWRPWPVPYGWRPYRDGRWVWTEAGWMWATDEPWGWATYHYGRWVLTVEFGWLWVPGNEWAPAWVCWRRGPDFVGWAPLPPGAPVYGPGFDDIAFGISFGAWTMVFDYDFLAPHCGRVAFPPHRCHEMLPRATRVCGMARHNGIYVNPGPGHRHIERACHRSVPALRLRMGEDGHDHRRVHVKHDHVVVPNPAAHKRGGHADQIKNVRRASEVTVVKSRHSPSGATSKLSSPTATTSAPRIERLKPDQTHERRHGEFRPKEGATAKRGHDDHGIQPAKIAPPSVKPVELQKPPTTPSKIARPPMPPITSRAATIQPPKAEPPREIRRRDDDNSSRSRISRVEPPAAPKMSPPPKPAESTRKGNPFEKHSRSYTPPVSKSPAVSGAPSRSAPPQMRPPASSAPPSSSARQFSRPAPPSVTARPPQPGRPASPPPSSSTSGGRGKRDGKDSRKSD
jgi:hypothetical protein